MAMQSTGARTISTALLLVLPIGLSLLPLTARGGSSNTDDVACGASAAGWDAPRGTVVSNRAAGPIREVLSAVGESRTHTMLSHGAGSGAWVTHGTMHAPGTTGWPTYCSTPLRPAELARGYPGVSQVDQGAIYTYLYGNGSPEYLRSQVPTSGTAKRSLAEGTANWLWNGTNVRWFTSKQDAGRGLWRVGVPGSNWSEQPYTLYQFRQEQSRTRGADSTVWNNGAHCTTTIAWAYSESRYGADYIVPHTYDHSQVVAAGDSLYSGVKSSCENGTGFWTDVGAAITCFESICDDMGRQVRNCMAAGRCDTDSDSVWSGIKNDPGTTATSLSPDDLLGWSGHNWSGKNVGPWAGYGYATTLWNSGGNVYGCWF